jgi:probable F420-dependent oxidoreductase
MSFPTRIGVQLQPQHSPNYGHLRDAVLRCEDMGVDVAFNWDHFYPLYGDPDGAHYECWTMLGAWAEQTSRIEIGALVTCNSYRNPELLADMARTVDNISDYDEYGYDFGTVGSRLDDLAAAMPRITSRLGKLNPAPVRDIPILIGGQGEKKTLRLVAEYAHMWHGFTTTETYPGKAEVLDRHCADMGRDPSTIERSAGVENDSGVATGEGLDSLLANAEALVDLGVSLLTVGVNGPDYDLSSAEALCRWRDSRA